MILETLIEHIVPSDLSGSQVIGFVALSFCTSALTAAFGIGGGIAMLVFLAYVLPVATLIPIHAVIQLGSNVGRALVQRNFVLWPIVLWFGLGGGVGAALGGQIVFSFPDQPLKLILAAFIIWSVWGAKPTFAAMQSTALVFSGFLSTILTMIIGSTGPVVAAILAPQIQDRRRLVATHAACMVLQHSLKAVVFGFLGFAFQGWAVFLALMIASGFCGTLAGSKLLAAIGEVHFRRAFKALMTVLALILAVRAVSELFLS